MGVIMYKGEQYGNQFDISGKVDKVIGKGLSSNDYTDAEKLKLSSIATGAQANTVTGVKGSAEADYRAGNINITKVNIGLGNVDNTSDANKPISSATQTALNNKISTSLKGAANGVAELDENGKVPTSQLPSFIDDVIEYSSLANFPLTGESGKIYVDTFTNLTYRWSGSEYIEISPSLALGETSATAFRGDYGKIAYDHAQMHGSAFSSGFYKIATNSEGHVTNVTLVEQSDITNLGIPNNSTATISSAGLMSSDDKSKLNGITLKTYSISSSRELEQGVSGDTGELNFNIAIPISGTCYGIYVGSITPSPHKDTTITFNSSGNPVININYIKEDFPGGTLSFNVYTVQGTSTTSENITWTPT